jgi:hypothetical protein
MAQAHYSPRHFAFVQLTAAVVYLSQGQYQATLTPTVAGVYSLSITLSAAPITGSPFAVTALAAAAAATTTVSINPNCVANTVCRVCVQS